MWALLKKVIGAVTMSEIVEFPRLSRSRRSALDGLLINEQCNVAQVPLEVFRIRIRFRQLRRCRFDVVFGRGEMTMSEPLLQIPDRHWFSGVIELRGDGRSGAVARDGPLRISFRHTSLTTQHRDQPRIEMGCPNSLPSVGEQAVECFSRRVVNCRRLLGADLLSGKDRLTHCSINRFNEICAGLICRHFQPADSICGQHGIGVGHLYFFTLHADTAYAQPPNFIRPKPGEEPDQSYMLGTPRSGLRRRVSTASGSERPLAKAPLATARGTDPVDALRNPDLGVPGI